MTNNKKQNTFTRQATAIIPTALGDFELMAYALTPDEPMPHLVIAHPDYKSQSTVTVRIHSECLTGDIFGSNRCDCGQQLSKALYIISKEKGILIYLRQEGRGIGLINKLKAYNLQDKGLNTIDANIHMGFEADERDYAVAIHILNDLKIKQLNLLTNNPEKIDAFKNRSIKLIKTLSLEISPTEENLKYLKTKKELMGHLLKL